MQERTLTEREAFRAARCFLEQFNEREHSEAIMLLIGWMEEGSWTHDSLETRDPAQWGDWSASVDRVVAARPGAINVEHTVDVVESSKGPAQWHCSCGAISGAWWPSLERGEIDAAQHVRLATGA